MDVRAGGRYRMSFKTEDGESHQVGGVYREVVPDSRLVFSWAWHSTPERESLVTVTVKPDGDGSILTLLTSSSSTKRRATATSAAGPARSTSSSAISPDPSQTGDDHGKDCNGDQALRRSRPRHHDAARGRTARFHWNELRTRDARARQEVLPRHASAGPSSASPTPDGTDYWLAIEGGKPVAGLFPLTSPQFDGVPESWMSFLAVDDVDARVAKAVKAGAEAR